MIYNKCLTFSQMTYPVDLLHPLTSKCSCMNERTDTVTEVSFFKVIGQFLKMASPFLDILLNSPHKEEWLSQISKSSEFHQSFHLIFPKIIF